MYVQYITAVPHAMLRTYIFTGYVILVRGEDEGQVGSWATDSRERFRFESQCLLRRSSVGRTINAHDHARSIVTSQQVISKGK